MLNGKNLIVTGLLVASLVSGISVPQVDASPVGGRKYSVHRVNGRSTDVFAVRFFANSAAAVVIDGDGDTDLDLYVYDENGNLIGSDTDGTDTCVVRFNPRWTGAFRIEVRNLGSVYNQYEIAAL